MEAIALTGAGRGIGLKLAKQHLQAGDRVLAMVRDPAKAETLAALAAGSGGRLTIHSACGIRALARDWTLDRSGEFLKWNGEPQPW